MRGDPRSGLYVFINRYDSVDLPGDACHVLVIDGLPSDEAGSGRVALKQPHEVAGSDGRLARGEDPPSRNAESLPHEDDA